MIAPAPTKEPVLAKNKTSEAAAPATVKADAGIDTLTKAVAKLDPNAESKAFDDLVGKFKEPERAIADLPTDSAAHHKSKEAKAATPSEERKTLKKSHKKEKVEKAEAEIAEYKHDKKEEKNLEKQLESILREDRRSELELSQ